MNRTPLYATNSTLNNNNNNTDGSPIQQNNAALAPAVIRPPIREAYDTQQKYDQAVQTGIDFAREKRLQYIDHY
jgi:hypothetical protein